jgi:hypothetical protein
MFYRDNHAYIVSKIFVSCDLQNNRDKTMYCVRLFHHIFSVFDNIIVH